MCLLVYSDNVNMLFVWRKLVNINRFSVKYIQKAKYVNPTEKGRISAYEKLSFGASDVLGSRAV